MRFSCLTLPLLLLVVASLQLCSCTADGRSTCLCIKDGVCPTDHQPHIRLETDHGCPGGEVCCRPHKKARMITALRRRSPRRAMCGTGSPSSEASRGTTTSAPGEFPWMLAIFKRQNGAWSFHCGGSIIGKNLALTAAHCVDMDKEGADVGALRLRAGLWDLEDKDFQELQVEQIIFHPQYSRDPPLNDIAIIVTRRNFRPKSFVNTVCIPPPGLTFPPGTRCLVSGWGRDKFDSNSTVSTQLKKVEVPLVSHDACQKRLRRTLLGRFFLLDKSFICAGGEEGVDTCQGDGGSPLVCNHKGYYFQTGIVSWGIGCAERNLPAVYTDVTTLRDWVKEINDLYS